MRKTGQRVRRIDDKGSTPALLVAMTVLAGIALLARLGLLPHAVPWLYAGASLLTLFLYYRDKRAAVANRQRTPENTLHAWSLLGGWPGALYAQQRLRHKTSKQPFRTVFWLTAVLNLAALGTLASPPGAPVRATIDRGSERLSAGVARLPWREWIAASEATLDAVQDAR